MVSRLPFTVAVSALFASAPGQIVAQLGALTDCRPVANCLAGDAPCNEWIKKDENETLEPGPMPAGTPVIRVRLCNDGDPDPLCHKEEGISRQTVTVTGYAGEEELWDKVLTTAGPTDTGPFQRLPGLTRLTVECESDEDAGVPTGGHCQIVWQICREVLPFKSPLIEAEMAAGKDAYRK